MDLSIIIPVYNTAPYIQKCVESCLNQDLDKSRYEIIMVNDGSTDNSIEEIEKIKAHQNGNIVLINQENKGLSEARNAGLEVARGEYIWFIDSDDWIEENILSMLIDEIRTTQADVMTINPVDVFPNETFAIMKKKENIPFFGACFYVVKRELIQKNRLKFIPNILHEDCLWTPDVLRYAQRIEQGEGHFCYYVYHREGSITRTVNPQRCYDLLFIAKRYVKILSETNSKETQKTFNIYLGMVIDQALKQCQMIDKKEKKKFVKTMAKNPKIFKALIKSRTFPYWAIAILYYIGGRKFLMNYGSILNMYKKIF